MSVQGGDQKLKDPSIFPDKQHRRADNDPFSLRVQLRRYGSNAEMTADNSCLQSGFDQQVCSGESSVSSRFQAEADTRDSAIRTLVIGTGKLAVEAVRALREDHVPRVVIGYIDSDPQPQLQAAFPGISQLGDIDDLDELVSEHRIQEVYVALPVRSFFHRFAELQSRTRDLGVPVCFRLNMFDEVKDGSVRMVGNTTLVEFNRHPANFSRMRIIKRTVDVLVSVSALLVLSPLYAAIALAIKLDSRGPVFFRQPRVSRGQSVFGMLKFRTMIADAEKMREEVQQLNDARGISFKIYNDPRVTRAGR